jgi:hypothetical protein
MPSLTGGVAGFDVKPKPTFSTDLPKSTPSFTPDISPVVVPDVKPDVTPIEVPSEIVVPVQEQSLITDQGQSPILDQTLKTTPSYPTPHLQKGKVNFGLPPSGFKFEGGGYSLPSVKKRSGLYSRRKVYPIFSAFEMVGGFKGAKKVKKR